MSCRLALTTYAATTALATAPWALVFAGALGCSRTGFETLGAGLDFLPSVPCAERTEVGTPCDGPDADPCAEGVWGCSGDMLTCGDESDDACGMLGAPKLTLTYNNVAVLNNAAVSLGSTPVGVAVTATFAVENLGTGVLVFSQNPPVGISGAGGLVVAQPGTRLEPNQSDNFTVSLTPGSAGVATATVSLPNNDADATGFAFDVQVTALAPPLVRVTLNSVEIANNATDVDIGSVTAGSSRDLVFTIHNDGQVALQLALSPKVALSGSAFSLVTDAPATIAASTAATFTVRFAPASVGPHSGAIGITSNAPATPSFGFGVLGVGLAQPSPDLALAFSGTPITAGGTVTATTAYVNTAKTFAFSAENTGDGVLSFATDPKVDVSGADFVLLTDLPASLAAGATASFEIQISPTALGDRSATVKVDSNDPNQPSFIFTFTVPVEPAPAPQIEVWQGTTELSLGGSFDVGTTVVGVPLDTTFTVKNTGTFTLNMDDTPRAQVTGTGFSLTSDIAASPLLPGESTVFTVRFLPSAVGGATGAVSIANDDATANPFVFDLTAQATPVPEPELDLTLVAAPITSGTTGLDLGTTPLSTPLDVVFTIHNTGDAVLNLTGTPRVAVTGAGFGLQSDAAASVAAGGNTTFTVRFTSATAGPGTGAFTIASNDADESSYTVGVVATAMTPPMVGGTGWVNADVGGHVDRIQNLALQADGRIVAAGYAEDASAVADFALARFLPDGSLDTSFSGDGVLVYPISAAADGANAVLVQTDGKIVAAGYSSSGANKQFALLRLTSAGAPDASFGSGGLATVTVADSFASCFAVAQAPDGKLVVAGWTASMAATYSVVTVVRLLTNGTPDTTFDGDGIRHLDLGNEHDRGYAVAVQTDGKIVVAGSRGQSGATDLFVARFNDNGGLDATFGSGGVRVDDFFGGFEEARDVAVMADGRVVVAGLVSSSKYIVGVARYTQSGTPDTTFNGTGRATTAVAPTFSDNTLSLAIEPDGDVVAGGNTYVSNNDFMAVRFRVNGTLDPTFSGDGLAIISSSNSDDFGTAVLVQADGKVVVGGSVGQNFGLVRLRADGSLDQ